MPKAKKPPAKRKLVTTAGGALAVVRRYFNDYAALPGNRTRERKLLPKGDRFLAWLWTEGFKVVSTDGNNRE